MPGLLALVDQSAALVWMRDASCRGVDPDLFFPERGESCRQAKAICAACPVRVECLDYAVANGEKYGIWAGTSERERRRMRRANGITARRPANVAVYRGGRARAS